MTHRLSESEDGSAVNQKVQRTDAYANVSRIVAAARSLFSAEGASATLAQVARRAGVGTATLYRHFPNRQALALAVCGAVAVVGLLRRRRLVAAYLVVTPLGSLVSYTAVKYLTNRARPTLNPDAGALNPAFPSGHAASAAAFASASALSPASNNAFDHSR